MLSLGVGALKQTADRGAGRQLQGRRGAVAGGLPLHPVTCCVTCMSPKAQWEPVVLFWFLEIHPRFFIMSLGSSDCIS